jgi:hypothetical protein
MNALIGKPLNLQQYQCRKCKRFFFIQSTERNSLDLDFGCPHGCDDNGRLVRNIKTEIKEIEETPQKKGSEDY